jgi:hypothetical protein
VISVSDAVYRRRAKIAGTLAYEVEIEGVAVYERPDRPAQPEYLLRIRRRLAILEEDIDVALPKRVSRAWGRAYLMCSWPRKR